ncbi:preprotein translocase subunit SecA [Tepidibacter thalassicus]|uniref:Protein translocase subunit SecA n=1 Tax=Tepidibacter thalassicus DSM 15285 TaxID=1123350 RepID=A0A1M5S5Q4_9FIRM|nr:preprotein translocase subunit SecA [Tepidibacter thalassicus]SHH33760.1 protein translocase subunit secA [Tepidibacter thalassicus DSM 15285]
MKSFIGGLINPHDRKIKSLQKKVDKILSFEDEMKNLSDEQLKNKTLEFKERLKNGQTLDDMLEEAFAVVREASYRVLGMKHFPVQLMGGIVLHEGNIAEMKTGEGKTLVATLPAYLNALTGDGVFVITVNDYLAARDKEEMGRVHEFLGLKVGFIHREMSVPEKKEAYRCDITYGTNSEFGFDYLRDNMALTKEMVVQRNLNYAIIDEVDSILIDEARTPLIITGVGTRASQYYITVDRFVKSLKKDEDYEVDNEKNIVNLTQEGMDKAERVFNLDNIADIKNTELLHHIRQSLHANYIMKKDQDYVVQNGEVLIVDKFTGRLMPGRRFSNGLHQAIEAKENLEIQKESKTQAMITYQNYFRMFNKISGMTGTAYTERQEFRDIYGMDVVTIPTNKPVRRIDQPDLLYKTKKEKLNAILDEVEKRHKKGQPILIGTIYIDDSEKLSEMLTKKGIKHNLLNAKQDKNEADIISKAGQKGAVTIATNMAGRGTDIKLGEGVAELGGLYVIGTERHDSRRIDNQLRGRSGRQGDPGESRFFISLEDRLFEKIDKDHLNRIKKMIDKLGIAEGEAIEDKLVSKAVEGVQKSIENINYRIRKSTLEFDQILNKQRETIYNERNKILNGEDMSGFIREIIKDVVDKTVERFTQNSPYPEEWDLKGLEDYLNNNLNFKNRVNLSNLDMEEIEKLDKKSLKDQITQKALEIHDEKEGMFNESQLRYLERLILMKSIDEKWVDHLDLVEQLRQGIGFQGIGGKDPVRVFNEEAYNLFEDMLHEIKELTVKALFGLINTQSQQEMERELEIKEEERKKRVLDLEDKYKVNRKYMMKIPANLPSIKFNLDINATEEIDAIVGLYYMENGYEQKLKDYEAKLNVKGVFPVEFKKPADKDWEMGWYQLKVFVAGQEATNINFLVVEPRDLTSTGVRVITNENIKFFSNKRDKIAFNLSFPEFDGDKIGVTLIYNGNKKNVKTFEINAKNRSAGIELNRPEDGWQNGVYEVIFNIGEKNISIPFMIVDEFTDEDKDIEMKVNIQMEENRNIKMFGQLINIDEKELLSNIPIDINKSGQININIDKQKNKLRKGRYEFRLIASNKVIFLTNFLVS